MSLSLERIRIANEDGEGALVYSPSGLVAILTVLSAAHDDKAGRWFVEHTFGVVEELHRDFASAEEALSAIEDEMRKGQRR